MLEWRARMLARATAQLTLPLWDARSVPQSLLSLDDLDLLPDLLRVGQVAELFGVGVVVDPHIGCAPTLPGRRGPRAAHHRPRARDEVT
ncbi:MAG: hypothetical protein ACRDZO_03360 [Egibacteraceae bacterium]